MHPRSTCGKTTRQGTLTWQLTIIILQLLNTDTHINIYPPASERPIAIQKNICFLLILLFLFIFGFDWLFTSLIKLNKSVNDGYYSSDNHYPSAAIIDTLLTCATMLELQHKLISWWIWYSFVLVIFISLLSHWDTLFQSVLWNCKEWETEKVTKQIKEQGDDLIHFKDY